MLPDVTQISPLTSKTATFHHSIDQPPHPSLPLIFVDVRRIIRNLNSVGTVRDEFLSLNDVYIKNISYLGEPSPMGGE
jgi:hypothetical protein